MSNFKWSSHAFHRWNSRFKGIDKHIELNGASNIGAKSKKKIKSLCPVTYEKYMGNQYNGRYALLGQSNIVFIIAGDDQTVITVYHLHNEIMSNY